ncbi:MAG TPA: type III-B CRISPR module RAMP protein Cmr4, partial [Ignavibacteria bacterium]|nr:type III-B CRISPR module RAMP protein Cmr4 [Ignavibacteria bacterium]
FTDARLLLFPVKSMKGVFVYITCPKVLERFKNDLELCSLRFKNGDSEIVIPTNNSLKTVDDKGKCLVANKNEIGINGTAILEEYSFEIQNDNIENLANLLAGNISNDEIKNKLVILSDDDFRDFVNLSTEVITRTKINNETGTVQPGALFTEEYLPSETILYSLALTTPIFKEKMEDKGVFAQVGKVEEELVMEFFKQGIPEVMQIGGNATIGKGIVRINVWRDDNE